MHMKPTPNIKYNFTVLQLYSFMHLFCNNVPWIECSK